MSQNNDQDAPKETQAATAQSETAVAPAEAEAPFVDDIIIWSDGLDVPRKLTQEALQGLPKLPTTMLPPINQLIKQGVTIAAIPTTSGIGAACYLVNLTTLKKPDEDS
jgi:hypothetical protein